jgi:RNA polymerase sigma factor (TIGR02999 family)
MQADDAPAAITARFYDELRGIAGRLLSGERGDHTLQPTALVHEAYLRFATSSRLPDVPRAEQLALAARVLRQVLVDHQRARGAAKRSGGRLRVELDPELASGQRTLQDSDVLHDFDALNGALERLRQLDERQAEVVLLRAFGGLTMEQVALALRISKRTAEADWTVARAWLSRELSRNGGG